MNRREFLQLTLASASLVPLTPVLLPRHDHVRDLVGHLQGLIPNGISQRRWGDVRGGDFADAFALVERYDLKVGGVLVHPDTWAARHPSVESFTTTVLDLDLPEREGAVVALMWGARVRTHEAAPLGTVYILGEQGLANMDRAGRTHGLSVLQLHSERHTYS